MVHFDDILRKNVGEFGKYQKILCFLVGMVTIPCAYHNVVPAFHFVKTDAWCKIPNAEEAALQVCVGNVTAARCMESLKSLAIPVEERNDTCGPASSFSRCYRYDVNVSQYVTRYSVASGGESYGHENLTKIKCDHGWEYDTSQYKNTVIQQFDLVCDNINLKAMATSIFIIGILFGSFIFGLIIDGCGRKRGLMIGITMMTIHGVITAFSPSLLVFMVTRFFVGSATFGAYLSGFLLVFEFVGPSKRAKASLIYCMLFGVGYLLLAPFAYFFRNWRILQMVISVPTILFLSYWCVIPESPRWLISHGRNDEAEKIIRKCVRINKVLIHENPPNQSSDPLGETEDGKKNTKPKCRCRCAFLDLCRLANMRKKIIILCYVWVVNTLLYYGLPFSISTLGKNDYSNCVISGILEISAYFLCIFIIDVSFLGRRWSIFNAMAIAGVTCACAGFVPRCGDPVWLGTVLACISKFFITCSFAMVYIFTAELMPTPARSVGVGTCSLVARIVGMFAPHLLLMSELWINLPAVFFGVASIIAGVLVLFLPETEGEDLQETMEEGERFGKSARKSTATNSGYGEIRQLKNSLDSQL
ncbi:organic cation transporter protein-like [Ptychodera flava]|uniref:organic cation transporter protein-like n=1 Tax=Ptychodera flava TaxID=63121 RepID=UPI00396A2F9F